MKEGFRQSMAWLHTWTGLLFGWLLFAMFVTGTSAYFQEEISRWMRPELTVTADPETATQAAIGYLHATQPDAENWFITPPSARSPVTTVFWQPRKVEGQSPPRRKRGETSATLDGKGTPVTVRQTSGGYFLYRFHFDLHYMPVMWARYLVGAAAMFMLVAIVSGVITHKKIFADFFMLRFGKGQRSWLDAHNVTAVFALPFYLMITYTGLITLATQYMPWGVMANYTSQDTFFDEMFPSREDAPRTGIAAPLVSVKPLMAIASRSWGGAAIGSVQVSNPGDRSATIRLTRAANTAIGARGESIVFAGSSGRLLETSAQEGGALATQSVMVGLHAGRFAGWGLRWLYFLSGIGGTLMVGTGLILWTVKRRAKLPDPTRPHFGFRLVERLNVATIAGLPAGLATYFLANRLLPAGLADRAEWEVHSLFGVWGGILLWVIVRPYCRAWVESLSIAAALFATVPVVNALTTSRNTLAALVTGDWLFVAFDVAMLVLATGFGLAARKAATVRPLKAVRRSRKIPEALVAA
ncbi:PepSY-associated TM helix domain-containing protein [Novosphingobium sp. Rr 2-17]|uniref:PepSY-associated TM helix domain-containing protein n=1 Tax=Novosphingobium sp. Rr 2-17 TaxID=555793 RepID=UPI0002699C0D|nr:PepSY-associated TM helix domain-containing protein [Novosphingobium sp. Rr 2-17]EIZ77420.1 PepSY-associated TM helix domain-containing protein [Novosphingobium sp. Rr 2-17]